MPCLLDTRPGGRGGGAAKLASVDVDELSAPYPRGWAGPGQARQGRPGRPGMLGTDGHPLVAVAVAAAGQTKALSAVTLLFLAQTLILWHEGICGVVSRTTSGCHGGGDGCIARLH